MSEYSEPSGSLRKLSDAQLMAEAQALETELASQEQLANYRQRRKRQSELIRRWRPWERATGPRTGEGRARVSRNAYKGGVRLLLRQLAQLLR